jgi:hypothetical protein
LGKQKIVFLHVRRVLFVPISEKNTPLAFQINLPPLAPFPHKKNGSAKQKSCLGGGGRVALKAM